MAFRLILGLYSYLTQSLARRKNVDNLKAFYLADKG